MMFLLIIWRFTATVTEANDPENVKRVRASSVLSGGSSLTSMKTPIEGEVVLRTGMENSLTSLSSGSAVTTRRASVGNGKVRGVCSSRTCFSRKTITSCQLVKYASRSKHAAAVMKAKKTSDIFGEVLLQMASGESAAS